MNDLSMSSFSFELGDGNRMPGVGLGTFQARGPEVVAAVASALKLGYRHVDTAESYGNEAEVGKGLQESGVDRTSVFITTKLWPGNPAWGMPTKTYEQTIEACKKSVADLGVTSVDLYIIHAPFGGKEGRLAQWKGLVECKRLGLVKSVGVSNWGLAHLQEIAAAGLPMPAANQLELHPLSQKAELLAFMRQHNILPIAYSSLVLLSSWRKDYTSLGGTKTTDETQQWIAPVELIATRLDVSAARVLLRYSLQKGWPCLPKSTKEERVRENLDLDSFALTDEDMATLDGLECGVNLAWDAPPGEHFDLTTVA